MSGPYTLQIAEVPALSPNADIEEIKRWALLVAQWMRAREPVSSGDALTKFATRQELLDAGLVQYSTIVQNSSAKAFTVNPSLLTPSAATLTLSANRYYFDFDDAVDTTPTGATITLTSSLAGATGYVTFTAVGYDSNHLPLGTIPLTGVTATTAQLTGTDFINGLGANVRYVKVVATNEGLSGYVYIYRREAGVGALIMHLSTRYALVTTAQGGGNGDFSAIDTRVILYRGDADETSLWDFAITATNCTAQINNAAGPITGSSLIKVAVTGLSASQGNVLITATRTANPTQTATFEVGKDGFRP